MGWFVYDDTERFVENISPITFSCSEIVAVLSVALIGFNQRSADSND
jgi:hypothetical protein